MALRKKNVLWNDLIVSPYAKITKRGSYDYVSNGEKKYIHVIEVTFYTTEKKLGHIEQVSYTYEELPENVSLADFYVMLKNEPYFEDWESDI